MNTSSFLQSDGTLRPTDDRGRHGWLPTLTQLQQALRFDFSVAQPNGVWAISMRQGMGLIVVTALVAGLLPFLVNWVTAARLGTALPLAELAHEFETDPGATGWAAGISDTWQTLAGLPPAFFPGWLAAFLSSLGAWINWPLNWLAWWIAYGAGVLAVAKVWGAPTTLQRFFAMTSYAALPLLLLALGPIPCLGALARIIGVLWMLALYTAAVRAVTGLDWGRAVAAVLAPGALLALLTLLAGVAFAVSLLRWFIIAA